MNVVVEDAERIPDLVEQAYRVATSGCPGPVHLQFRGPEGEVELPREAHEILTQVVAGMRSGQAIVVTPQSLRLTTQQAADLLGVSRPTVVKFIESGELRCERTSHRRVLRLEDVMAFQSARRERQLAAVAAYQEAVEFDHV